MIVGSFYDAQGVPKISRCFRAESLYERMRGLLGRPQLAADEGMLILPCGAVHTLGMRYAIDVVYLDRTFNILKCVEALVPWRLSACPAAHATLELIAGTCARLGLAPGVALNWRV